MGGLRGTLRTAPLWVGAERGVCASFLYFKGKFSLQSCFIQFSMLESSKPLKRIKGKYTVERGLINETAKLLFSASCTYQI